MSVRVRFAPSPTGYLHVGGARTALFNWLFARKEGGKFLLRIEDTDKARSTDESTRAIFEGLTWLGLNWDEDVVFQGANVKQHQVDAYRLLESGAAYRDFTTAEELARMRAEAEAAKTQFKFDRKLAEIAPDELKRRLDAGVPFSIRFRVPDGETAWDDLVHGRIAFPNKDVDDFIILRSDGTPVYNHAVVSDDIAMKITHVMRGDDHISNTPKQIMLYNALGAALPKFGHLPMIHGTDGKKLSKRTGAAAVGDWQHAGILPSAMNNFLSLLGWSPGHDIEVMTTQEMIERFSTDHLLKKPSIFDPKKLEWMNGQHIARATAGELMPHLSVALTRDGVAPEWLGVQSARAGEIVTAIKSRARTLTQLASELRVFFERPDYSALVPAAKKLLDNPNAKPALESVRAALSAVSAAWTTESVHATLEPVPATVNLKPGEAFQPLRAALTGSNASPDIYTVVFFLGREESLARIELGLRA